MTPLFIKAIKPVAKKSSTVRSKEPPAEKTTGKSDIVATPRDISHFHDLFGMLASHKAGSDFGPECVEVGHHVAFKAGDFSGSGKVSSTGRDGLCVTDSAKREHRVHWREVTGHFAPEKEGTVPRTRKSKVKGNVDGK